MTTWKESSPLCCLSHLNCSPLNVRRGQNGEMCLKRRVNPISWSQTQNSFHHFHMTQEILPVKLEETFKLHVCTNEKVKIAPPCTPWRHAGRANLELHSFLASALDGAERSISRPGRFTPGNNSVTYRIGSWVCSRVSLEVFGVNKHLSPLPEFEPRIIQSVA
jgi:hypothetical protein